MLYEKRATAGLGERGRGREGGRMEKAQGREEREVRNRQGNILWRRRYVPGGIGIDSAVLASSSDREMSER
jgi:hypothetical protein